MKTALGTILITEEEIRSRISELGRAISKDYAGLTVTLVGILKGSFVFLADVIRAISLEVPVEVDFMSVSSYGDATITSGTVHIEKDLGISIDGKDAKTYPLAWLRGQMAIVPQEVLLFGGTSRKTNEDTTSCWWLT